jgi:hypothetical protein
MNAIETFKSRLPAAGVIFGACMVFSIGYIVLHPRPKLTSEQLDAVNKLHLQIHVDEYSTFTPNPDEAVRLRKQMRNQYGLSDWTWNNSDQARAIRERSITADGEFYIKP